MEVFNSRRVTNIGVMMLLYAAATFMCGTLVVGRVQLVLSDMLILLCAFNADYIISMSLGSLIVSLFVPMPYAIALGTAAMLAGTALVYVFRKKTKLFVLSLIPVVLNSAAVGLGLTAENHEPFWINAGWTALGEFICVSLIGTAAVSFLKKNKELMKLVTAGHENGIL